MVNKIQKHFVNCLIAGAVAILPILGFILFVGFIESQITNSGILEAFGIYFPGLGILVCIILVYVFGLIVTTFIGKWIWNKVDFFIDKFPVLGDIYRTIKDLLGYDTSKETIFKKAVLVKSYIGEEVGLVTEKIELLSGETTLVVFIPFAPTPTSGRIVYVNEADVKDLDVKAADVLANMISMGKTEKIKNEVKKIKPEK